MVQLFQVVEYVRAAGTQNAGAGRPAFMVGTPNPDERGSVLLLVLHHPEDREAGGPWDYRFDVPEGGQHFPPEAYYVTTPGQRPAPTSPPGGWFGAMPTADNSGLQAQVAELTALVRQLAAATPTNAPALPSPVSAAPPAPAAPSLPSPLATDPHAAPPPPPPPPADLPTPPAASSPALSPDQQRAVDALPPAPVAHMPATPPSSPPMPPGSPAPEPAPGSTVTLPPDPLNPFAQPA